MSSAITAAVRQTGEALRHVPALVLLTLLMAAAAAAQTTTTTSSTDGRTPSGLQAGAPAGSYALSGFENVNIYNGNLDFRLPLLNVKGRGSAQMTIALSLNLKSWHVKHIHKVFPDESELDSYVPTQTGWIPTYSGYGAGAVTGRSMGLQVGTLFGGQRYYSKTLTRITFSTSDGTEYEFRDQSTGGQPLNSTSTQGAARGTVFVTAEGTAATFISDTPIYDDPTFSSNGPRFFSPSGYLMLRDGTRYRIDGGNITWIRDRNGNKLSFSYTDTSMTVTDSLGRVVSVNYNVSDIAPYGLCDQVVFNGFGGAQRIIRVSHTDLANALRPNSGYSVKTLGGAGGLFPELNGASTTTTYDPTVSSAVWLPDGRSYKFYYNSYGELARVELPTGGAMEYDMNAGSGAIAACQYCDVTEIYRRVAERRVYSDGSTGAGFEQKEVYTNSESVGTPSSTITVEQSNQGGTVLSRSRHYFDGSALDSLFVSEDMSYPYETWYEGNERQTEDLDASGSVDTAAVLRRVVSTRVQRASVPWWSSYASTYGLDQTKEPPNDPREVTTVTTVEPDGVNLVSKQTSVNPLDGSIAFDQYNNPTDIWEYDYAAGGPGPLLRRKHTDYLTAASYTDAVTGAHLRSLITQQWISSDAAGGTKVALTTFAYDQFTLTDRPGITGQCPYYDVTLGQPRGQCSTTGPNGEQPTALTIRGNMTGESRYSDAAAGAGALTSSKHYDIAGNAVSTTDPLGNTTNISYDDSFCNDGGIRCNGGFTSGTYAFQKSVTTSVPDASALYGFQAGTFSSTLAFTTSTVYDFYSGLVYSTTDANGKTTTLSYKDAQNNTDPLDRLKSITRPDGGRTDFNYGDTVGNLYLQVFTDLDAGRRTESRQYFDGLGRGVRSFRWENQDASNPWLTVDTQYDALGRVWQVSDQYRSAGPGSAVNHTGRWTQNAFDSLGRQTQAKITADGAVITTAYSGDKALVTDQIGREKITRSDSTGRLTDVWQVVPADPSTESVTFQGVSYTGYHTVYGYDVLGNLRTVVQASAGGTQTRTFFYDSLSRLTSAANPESGNVTYTYDDNGNISTKTDARNVVTTYRYDHLNRNIITSYAGGGTTTPTVYRYYDFASNGLGRPYRSEATSVAQSTFTAYDESGRPTQYQQKFWVGGAWSQAYTVQQAYNKAGSVTSEVYPSGHSISYSYDAAGRLGDAAGQPAFAGNLGDGTQRTYASSVLYDQTGGMSQERFGTDTPLYHKLLYNPRGQLAEIRVGTAALPDTGWQRGAIINHYSDTGWGATGGGPDNNGNLHRQDIFIPNFDGPGYDQGGNYGLSTQNFSYDSWNRLSSVTESSAASWNQTYTYDRFGNRTINASATSNAPATQFSVDLATNRLGVPAVYSGVMSYDQAGNLVVDTYTGAGARVYDAENRMTSAQINSSQSATYTYDADGRRVRRNTGAGEVWQVYGMGGELLAEYASGASASVPQQEYGYRNGRLLFSATVTSGWGAAPVIHDNPLVVRQTTVQSRHITELRDAINALRSHLGMSAYTWQSNASVGAPVKADPILEMRTALDQALGAPAGGYSAGLALGQPIRAVHIQELRDRVLAAWQGGSGLDFRWLVCDQLGTPRMAVDKSGSLAGVKRHDYMPFGEEIPGDPNWRTTGRGYAGGDVRQKFTGYERDAETGLDYAQARYFSNSLGRFTSPDDFLKDSKPADPSSWNLYAYARNNPLKFVDPSGNIVNGAHLSEAEKQRIIAELAWLTGYSVGDIYFDPQTNLLTINPAAQPHGGSVTARRLLNEAINTTWEFQLESVNSTDVAFTEHAPVLRSPIVGPNGQLRSGGVFGQVRIDFGDFDRIADDDTDAGTMRSFSLGINLLHEFVHGLYPNLKDDEGPGAGEIEETWINPIRQEMGLPTRVGYSAISVTQQEAQDYSLGRGVKLTFCCNERNAPVATFKNPFPEETKPVVTHIFWDFNKVGGKVN